jgi:hypothetical protein
MQEVGEAIEVFVSGKEEIDFFRPAGKVLATSWTCSVCTRSPDTSAADSRRVRLEIVFD